jgi:hypothetical protein
VILRGLKNTHIPLGINHMPPLSISFR